MIPCASASPPAINFPTWVSRRQNQSFTSGFSLQASFTFPLTGTAYTNNKFKLSKDNVIVGPVASSPRPRTLNKEKNPRRLTSTDSQSNKLAYFQIIRYPLATESAIRLILDHNTLIFVVDKYADKKSIKEAVKKLLNVSAKSVNTLMTPDGTKKAFITLAPEFSALDVAKKINVM